MRSTRRYRAEARNVNLVFLIDFLACCYCISSLWVILPTTPVNLLLYLLQLTVHQLKFVIMYVSNPVLD